MADASFPKRIAFAYLENLKEKFFNKYPNEQRNRAIAFSMNNTFADTIRDEMARSLIYNLNFLPKLTLKNLGIFHKKSRR
jgi:hypothetical protein